MVETLTNRGAGAPERPPDPQLINAFDDKGHGRWYAGASVKGGSGLPVIVFVPGLGDYAPSFWSKNELYQVNDLYALAQGEGFRTAFVSFMADGEKPFDMWRNGRMFAWQLEEICRYYKTENVVVVAHSKGGVDAQTAGVYFGVGPRISRLITLSSPHWGSQLADLAYSSFCWELAEDIGQHSEGCFCMQTAYMRSYRKSADISPFNTMPPETFAGNGTAPAFSGLWAGSLFLSLYGENDGVVTVASAHNPKGLHFATLPLNHYEMMTGQKIWQYLKPAVLRQRLPRQILPGQALPWQLAGAEVPPAPFGLIFRGGSLDTGVADEFPVDSTVKSLEVFIALSGETGQVGKEVQFFSPGGVSYSNFQTANGPFGLRLLSLKIDNPQVGNWHMLFVNCKGTYFTQIRMNGTFRALPEEVSGGIIGVSQGASDVMTVLRLLKTYADHYEMAEEHKVEPGGYRPPFRLGDGSYTIESSVKGVLADGSRFERNILRSVLNGGIELIKKGEELSVAK